MGETEEDEVQALVGGRPARPAARGMSDLLTLDDAGQELVHWLMRKGEVVLEQIAAQCTDGDSAAAQEMVGDLVRQGFIQEMRLGGVSHYRARLQTRPGRQLPRSVWQALYDKLTDVFDHEGEAIELGGNRPLRLDGTDSVWMVRSGEANVYGVRLADGEPAGARQYQLTATVGQAVFGLGQGCVDPAAGLILLGTAGAVLRRLDRARLQELAAESRHTEQVVGLLADWVERVQAVWPLERTPQSAETIRPGQPLPLLGGAHARTPGGVLWVTVQHGHVHVAGRTEIDLAAGSGYFPLSGDVWVTAGGRSADLQAADGASWLAEDRGWRALDALNAMALSAFAERARTEGERQRQRLATRAASDRASVSGAMLRLTAVLDRRAASAVQAIESDDPLLGACRLVGDAIGMEIHAPARSERSQPRSEPLDRIARASRIRTRRVMLRDGWWREDNGPLVAFRQDGAALALLPDPHGRYFMVDPVSRQRNLVTPALAATLDPAAFMLYRAFTARTLAAADLIRFGLRGGWRDQTGVLLYGIGGGLIALLTPVLTGVLFNSVIPNAQRSGLVAIVGALVLAAITAAVFQFARSIAFLRTEGRMAASLQAAVWDRLLALPVAFFRDYSAGDLSARAMGIDGIRQLLTGSVTGALLAGIFSLFSWLLLFYYDWQLAVAATLLGVIVVAFMVVGGMAQVRHQRRMYDMKGRLSGLVVQFITGIAKLRVAGAERRAFAVWSRGFAEQNQESVRARLSSLPAFEAAYPTLATLIIFGLVASQPQSAISTGSFLAFVVALNQYLNGILLASKAVTVAMQAGPFYQRSRPLLETPPELDAGRADPGELSGEIEISHLSFRYAADMPPVLHDVSLHVRAGQFIAIVGPSGTGKSTIFRLLLGFERPEAGALFYDGQEIGSLDPRALRRQIGVVMQNGRLQPGELYASIVGTSQLTLSDAWEAARMVGLDEDIKAMPMGMQTYIMEGGSTLSGGQRQRLLIARAVVNRPRILLFDEATSALDNRTQAIISRSLEQLRATRIVIAHRLSTVINADCIYVLHGGQFVQAGTYEELMAQEGLFRELARRQLT